MNNSLRASTMSSLDIFMMRHSYDDHSYIDGKNDTSLTQRGVEVAHKGAKSAISMLERHQDGLSVHVSDRKRSIETMGILSEYLDKAGFCYDVTISDGLRELQQGEMQGLVHMTHDEKVRMLEQGWEIFDRERIAGNDDYKFGTPDRTDEQYRRFNTFVAPPYGESQNELSYRIEQAFLNALTSSVANNRVPFVLAHRGTIREILNIAHAHNNNTYDIRQNAHIEMSGWRYCELFTTNLLNVDFSMGALKRFVRDED